MFENKLCIKRKDIMERLNTVVGEVPTNHTYSKFMVVSVCLSSSFSFQKFQISQSILNLNAYNLFLQTIFWGFSILRDISKV